MTPKHTPGPWYLDATDDSIFVLNDLSDIVAIINREVVGIENCEADADLIAAAPELLEALEWIHEYIKRASLGHVDLEHGPGLIVDEHMLSLKLKLAIAKARGES